MKGTPTPKKGPSARVGSETKERGRAKSRSKSRGRSKTPQKEKLELSTIAVETKPDLKPKVATDTPLSNIKDLSSAEPKSTDDTSSVMPNRTETRTEEQSVELPTISDPKPEVMKGTPTPKKGRSKSRTGYQTPQKEKLELSTIAVETKPDPKPKVVTDTPILDINSLSSDKPKLTDDTSSVMPNQTENRTEEQSAELPTISYPKPEVMKGTPTPKKGPSARVGSETKEGGRAKSRSKSRAGYQTP